MEETTKPTAPELAAPPIVGAFLSEFSNVDNVYAILNSERATPLRIEHYELGLEVLFYGLHCLDRAVFAYWGAEYRATFMECALGLACETYTDALPESKREQFREGFKRHNDARQTEYGGLNLRETALPFGFARRVCFEAGAYNPAVLIAVVEWASGIPPMMLKIAETL